MFEPVSETKIEPPRLIPALTEGFNAVASHIYVILFPVLLDLLLWFGPLIRVKNILLPAMLNASQISAQAYGEDSGVFLDAAKQMWTTLLEQFNILYSMRTYPVGVPSLLINKGVLNNPLGSLQVIELQTADAALLFMLGLSLLGVVLGSLYFSLIAGVTGPSAKRLTMAQLAGQTLQCMLLSFILLCSLLVLSIPAVCLVSSLAFLLPSLGSMPLLLLGFILVWALLPVAFSPHGIFADQFKASAAIANSFRLVRASMNGTGMLFIILLLLGYGLDALWSTPAANSWMLLVGIVGHAFISSGLIAASFAFYNKGMKWLQAVVREINAGKPKIFS